VVGLDQPSNITTKRFLIVLQCLRRGSRPQRLISHGRTTAKVIVLDRRSVMRCCLWNRTRPVRSVVGQIPLSLESATRKKHAEVLAVVLATSQQTHKYASA
jgi:hypothetical protein